jgi:hypothetical protein
VQVAKIIAILLLPTLQFPMPSWQNDILHFLSLQSVDVKETLTLFIYDFTY